MTNPDCLIMDEPSEGLAPIIIQGVWEAIGKLKQEGLSILLVEQNASLALKLVDYVHVMSKGQVVYSAAPGRIVGQRRDQAQLSRHLIGGCSAACDKLAIISGDRRDSRACYRAPRQQDPRPTGDIKQSSPRE